MECGVHCEPWDLILQQNVAREGISVRMSDVGNRDSPGAISQEVPALPEILMNSPPGQLQKWPLLAIFRTPMTIFSQFMTTTGCKLGTRFGSFSPTNRSGYVSHNVCTFVLYSWKRERGNLAPLDNKLVMRHSEHWRDLPSYCRAEEITKPGRSVNRSWAWSNLDPGLSH